MRRPWPIAASSCSRTAMCPWSLELARKRSRLPRRTGGRLSGDGRVEDGTPIVVKKDDATPKVEVVDDTKPAPQLLPASAPVVDLPAGPEPGGVLRVNTDFGVVHVLVPEGVSEGARLELGGVVEVAVPPESAGDVVRGRSVEVAREDLGAALAVAFPVVVALRRLPQWRVNLTLKWVILS